MSCRGQRKSKQTKIRRNQTTARIEPEYSIQNYRESDEGVFLEAVSVKIIPLKYRVKRGGLDLIQLEDLCNFYTKNLVDRIGK